MRRHGLRVKPAMTDSGRSVVAIETCLELVAVPNSGEYPQVIAYHFTR